MGNGKLPSGKLDAVQLPAFGKRETGNWLLNLPRRDILKNTVEGFRSIKTETFEVCENRVCLSRLALGNGKRETGNGNPSAGRTELRAERCHEREAEASTPWHCGFGGPSMVRLDRPTARTHRAATRRVGDQAITSPGRCALNLSLRAQIDANDPDLRHEADRYIRPGQFPCSEAGLALRGPSWPHSGCASPGTSCSASGG